MGIIKVGDTFKNKCGTIAVVIGYENSRKITVEFQDDFKNHKTFKAERLRSGDFKNPYDKTILGVGYIGVGKYQARLKGELTEAYVVWASAMCRCYNTRYQKTKPTYKGFSLKEDWHNFQVFAEWYYSQNFCGLGYELDKDLIIKGNKIYGDETCCLVPREVNLLITGNQRNRGIYPQGVCIDKRNLKYRSRLSKKGKEVYLGDFNTPEEAFYAYKEAKEKYIKEVANKYKDQIDIRAYEALMRYEVNIDD